MHSETSYGCALVARPGVAVRANLALKETGDLWDVPFEDKIRNSFSTCSCDLKQPTLYSTGTRVSFPRRPPRSAHVPRSRARVSRRDPARARVDARPRRHRVVRGRRRVGVLPRRASEHRTKRGFPFSFSFPSSTHLRLAKFSPLFRRRSAARRRAHRRRARARPIARVHERAGKNGRAAGKRDAT